MGILYYVGI